MRTTLDLPDALSRQAKIAAVQRGMTFRSLVSQALERELTTEPRPPRRHLRDVPVIRSANPGAYELKPEQVAEILLREESAAYETALRREHSDRAGR